MIKTAGERRVWAHAVSLYLWSFQSSGPEESRGTRRGRRSSDWASSHETGQRAELQPIWLTRQCDRHFSTHPFQLFPLPKSWTSARWKILTVSVTDFIKVLVSLQSYKRDADREHAETNDFTNDERGTHSNAAPLKVSSHTAPWCGR